MLPADLADGALMVGTSDSCDWRIEAEGVPALAFYMKAIAGSLFVRAAGPTELRVDGHGVGSIWVPVERGARITIGGAQIEVGLAGRSRRAQHALLERAFGGAGELDAGERWIAPEAGWQAGGAPASSPAARALISEDAGPEPVVATQGDAGARAHAALAEALPGSSGGALARAGFEASLPALAAAPYESLQEQLFFEQPYEEQPYEEEQLREEQPRSPRASEQLWSATIFGAEDVSAVCACPGADDDAAAYIRGWGSTGLWIAGSLVACAYGCWVLLLDYF